MKAKYTFEIMDLDDGLVAVPVGDQAEHFNGVLKVNESGVEILKLLEQETTEETIVKSLLEKYDGDEKEISGFVHEFIDKLIAEGIVA